GPRNTQRFKDHIAQVGWEQLPGSGGLALAILDVVRCGGGRTEHHGGWPPASRVDKKLIRIVLNRLGRLHERQATRSKARTEPRLEPRGNLLRDLVAREFGRQRQTHDAGTASAAGGV